MNSYSAWGYWKTFGAGRLYSPLYGIWEVRQMSIDEHARPPLFTDSGRWRRAVFDFPNQMAFQKADDSFTYYGASIGLADRTLALTKGRDKTWSAKFTFQRPVQDQLILDGRMDDHDVHMELQLTDRNKFLLVGRGFHWIQEVPLNR